MKHYSEFKLDPDIPTIRTNKKIEFINLECGFDIETTSHYIDGVEKTAFMYIWAFGLGYGQPIYYGRTWDDFNNLIDDLVDQLDLSINKRLVIYVHNLSYEFQFMRKHFTWESVFAVDERKPIKAVTVDGIEFRDSYILSGFSLAKTAENLTTHTVKKRVGDLDYDLIRHHDTPLTPTELDYVKGDIEVVLAYINEQIIQYGDINKIPLTNTGRVRSYVRNECYYTSKNHRKTNKGKYTRYRKIMNDLTLDPDVYQQLKRGFMGGFTHANAFYTGELLEQVSSIDFTSSYPAVMLAEKFPMSRAFTPEFNNLSEFYDLLNRYCVIFDVKFYGLKAKITQENYLSESKTFQLEGSIINNGRIVSADVVATTLTDIDFKIMFQSYSWDRIEIGTVNAFHKAYLPKSIIIAILNLYQDKTVLKGVKGKEVEYLLSKGMLNSTYGMCVTDIIQDTHTYNDNEWGVDPANIDEQIDEYNNKKNRFLYYAWGVWITAYARLNLWTGILHMKEDYVYSDTDSIKLLNIDDHMDYINHYNDTTVEKLNQMMTHYKLDPKLLEPETIEGHKKMIGIWDFEGTYTRFKTLGSKRYLVEYNGKLEITVAGLSKQNGLNYMLRRAGGDHAKVFDQFTNNLYIPASETGKSTHTYIDHKQEFDVTDYKGSTQKVVTHSGVHLEQAEYTLNIAKQYGVFLSNLRKGYIYKGVEFK